MAALHRNRRFALLALLLLRASAVTDAAAPDDAARRLDLDAAAVRRQADLITGEFKGRAFADLAHDPRVARLLAGLSLAPPGDGAAEKQDEPFARERHWWDGL